MPGIPNKRAQKKIKKKQKQNVVVLGTITVDANTFERMQRFQNEMDKLERNQHSHSAACPCAQTAECFCGNPTKKYSIISNVLGKRITIGECCYTTAASVLSDNRDPNDPKEILFDDVWTQI